MKYIYIYIIINCYFNTHILFIYYFIAFWLHRRQHKIEEGQYSTGKNRAANVYPAIPQMAPLT